MNCLKYWARYVRKGEVKGRGINHHALVFWTYFLKGKYDSNT